MRVAIYTRVSTKKQREKFSLPSQKKILAEYAKAQGWEYILYDEGGVSGETIEDRPVMTQLLQDARQKKFNACLVIELERLSRDEDLLDWLIIKKTFREANIKMATPHQLYDLTNAEDDFMTNILGTLSTREKKKFLERAKRGALEAVRQGKYIGSHFRLGHKYNKETKKLDVVPEEAEVIRTIFKLSNEKNWGAELIADYLNSQGILSPMGFAKKKGIVKNVKNTRWLTSQVYRVLTNTSYYGECYYNKSESKNKKRIGIRPQSEWIKIPIEPVISKEIFDEAQERIKERAKWANRNTKEKYLLSGLLYCAECDSKMQGVTYKAYQKFDSNGNPLRDKRGYLKKCWKTRSYYKCYGRTKRAGHKCNMPTIRLEKIENVIWDEIKDRVKRPQELINNEILRKRKELEEKSDSLPHQLKELKKEHSNLINAQDRMLDAYSRGIIEIDELEVQMKALKTKRARVEAEIEQLDLQIGNVTTRKEKLEGLEAYLDAVRESIDDFNWEDKRGFLKRYIIKALVNRVGDIIIDGAFELLPKLVCSETGQGSFCSAWKSRFNDFKRH